MEEDEGLDFGLSFSESGERPDTSDTPSVAVALAAGVAAEASPASHPAAGFAALFAAAARQPTPDLAVIAAIRAEAAVPKPKKRRGKRPAAQQLSGQKATDKRRRQAAPALPARTQVAAPSSGLRPVAAAPNKGFQIPVRQPAYASAAVPVSQPATCRWLGSGEGSHSAPRPPAYSQYQRAPPPYTRDVQVLQAVSNASSDQLLNLEKQIRSKNERIQQLEQSELNWRQRWEGTDAKRRELGVECQRLTLRNQDACTRIEQLKSEIDQHNRRNLPSPRYSPASPKSGGLSATSVSSDSVSH